MAGTMDRTQDVEALHAIREDIERLMNANDPSFIARHMTDDVVAIQPGAPPLKGREANAAAVAGFMDAYDIAVTYESEEVVVGADLAFDRGIAREVMTPKAGGDPVHLNARYVTIYRRQPDGGWKQARTVAAALEG